MRVKWEKSSKKAVKTHNINLMLLFKRLHFSCHGQYFLIAALDFQTELVQLYVMNLILDGWIVC